MNLRSGPMTHYTSTMMYAYNTLKGCNSIGYRSRGPSPHIIEAMVNRKITYFTKAYNVLQKDHSSVIAIATIAGFEPDAVERLLEMTEDLPEIEYTEQERHSLMLSWITTDLERNN